MYFNHIAGCVRTFSCRVGRAALAATAICVSACASPGVSSEPIGVELDRKERGPEDEIIYFVMPDRFENGDPSNDKGGLSGDRLDHGFDPTDNGFYHGGDLEGLRRQLGYIQNLGATAIWLTPIFENKPVQGPPGAESAGYHGYWITDFTNVDPHIGDREAFRALVDDAHAKGMRVYMDIITNHSADVIKYVECHGPDAPKDWMATDHCPYRPLGDYPYTTRGGPEGETLNQGFLGDDPEHQTEANFARLTDPEFAYGVFIPEGEETIKTPAWLNDPIYYHNRGHTTFKGEDSLYGDFAGLDDLMTEHPRVVEGFIEIYKQWITDYKVDGFRIDTAKHVNPGFWQKVIPELEAHARAEGIEHFHIFGEVYEFDPGQLAVFTRRDALPTVLDFAFQGAARAFASESKPGAEMARMFDADHLYSDTAAMGRRLPIFLGNHDMGRFAGMVRDANPDANESELLARVRLGHAVMMFSRGVPTIYYGDEQGFVSDGGDRGARENMFVSRTPDYLDNDLLGTDKTTADRNFDQDHPLYQAIAAMAAIRTEHAAFRRGRQVVRHAGLDDSSLVFSRMSPDESVEFVAAFNADEESKRLSFKVDGRADQWTAIAGDCPSSSKAPGVLSVEVPALDFVICRAELEEQVN